MINKRKISQNTRGVTLVEMLVTISLFTVVSVISSGLLLDIVQLEKRTNIENAFYEDSRIILQQITNEIKAGTIDYEEYYSVNVLKSDFYGLNYGVYSSRFYDPGKSLDFVATSNPTNLGTECSYPPNAEPKDCEVFYSLSADVNTGQNPFNYSGANPVQANAFCDSPQDLYCQSTSNIFDELYLIDSTGTKKTILGRKLVNGTVGNESYVLGIMRLNGKDLDQNGLVDTFICSDEFNCPSAPSILWTKIFNGINHPIFRDAVEITNHGLKLPQRGDLKIELNPASTEFIPLSPVRSNIKDLKFIITPLEDPYKAFNESESQVQPTVKIQLTLGLNPDYEAEYPGQFADVTVQATIAAGVRSEIVTFPPTDDLSWIRNLTSPPPSTP